MVSIGKHYHPPPESSKTPARLIANIDRLIQRINDPSLTLSNLFIIYFRSVTNVLGYLARNPIVEEFCRQHNINNLSELHPSLANTDKIRSLLKKNQLLQYPYGQDLEAIHYQLLLQKQSEDEPVSQNILEIYS